MVNYREILRRHRLHYSQREIASSVHHSRDTVSEVIRIATAFQLRWPLEDDVTISLGVRISHDTILIKCWDKL